jgi:hypothetical protein
LAATTGGFRFTAKLVGKDQKCKIVSYDILSEIKKMIGLRRYMREGEKGHSNSVVELRKPNFGLC